MTPQSDANAVEVSGRISGESELMKRSVATRGKRRAIRASPANSLARYQRISPPIVRRFATATATGHPRGGSARRQSVNAASQIERQVHAPTTRGIGVVESV